MIDKKNIIIHLKMNLCFDSCKNNLERENYFIVYEVELINKYIVKLILISLIGFI